MSKKKIIFDILILTIAFVLFISWHKNIYKSVPTLSESIPQVYLITMDKTSEFWYTLDKGARDMAEVLGVSYTWEAPKERIVEEQITIFNNAVAAGADAIMLAASDPDSISSAVEDAKAKGVKIIYVDAPANVEAIVTLATENYSAGQTAGITMLSELEAAGIQSGSIGILGVTPINITTVNREKGFREIIATDGRFTLLDTKYPKTNLNAIQEAAAAFIDENADLVGLYGTNEGTTLGIGYAIRASNKEIVGIGFDITDEIRTMIKDDILQAVLAQNPYSMGYLGMAETVAALKGYDTGPSFIDTGVSIITKDQPLR